MLRQGWSQERNVANTSHRYCVNFIVAGQTTSWIQDDQLGIPSAVKQSTYLSGRRYSSRLRKFCSLPQVLFGEKVLCHSCSHFVLVTDVLLHLDHVSGTTYLPVCETRKSAAQNSENNWKHSCFRRTAAHRDFFWLMRLINTLTYLLTYLHTLDGDFMSRKISRLTLIEWEEDATEQPVRSHDPADRLNKRAVVSRDVSNCQVSWILMSSHRLPIRESSSGGDAMRIQSRSNLCMSPTSIY